MNEETNHNLQLVHMFKLLESENKLNRCLIFDFLSIKLFVFQVSAAGNRFVFG